MPNRHGGPRPGSGRPAVYKERQRRYAITLPRHLADALRAHGDGNLSAGVRRLAEKLAARRGR